MNHGCSRVPHLARAIAKKQKLRSRACDVSRTGLQSFPRSISTSTQCRSVSQAGSRGVPPIPQSVHVGRMSPHQRLSSERPSYGFEQDAAPPITDVKRRRYYFITSLFVAWVGAYTFYVYRSYQRDVEEYNKRPDKLEPNADVSDRWKSTTRNFDYEVGASEKAMLMKRKRRRLIQEAYGDVLEVSVGTGRNMDLYDTRPFDPLENASYGRSTRHMITSLTFNDQSEVMIENAKKKWQEKQKEKRQGDRFTGHVKFVLGDAGKPGVVERPEGGFDTIVQSMGICSMADPVGFLRHLGRLARQPGEKIQNASSEKARKEEDDGKGGRIFLLEHGRAYSRWAWLNSYLDGSAAMHADRYGCWFNKDIGKVIEESGLVVERRKRYSFGTVWEIVLRPAPGPLPGETVDGKKEEVKASTSRSWWSWLSR